MAAPTEAEIQDQIGKIIQIADEIDKFGRSNTKNVGAMYDGLVAVLEGDFASFSLTALDGLRSSFSDLMAPGTLQPLLDPLLLEYAKQLGIPETDPQDIFDRLFQDFLDNGKTVQSRVFSFGSPAAGGSNAGNGALNRLTTDRGGKDIENQTADAKTVKCIQDEHSGATEHREVFEIRGSNPARDFVAGIKGGQRIGTLQAINADDSAAYVQNPSFNQYSGSSLTALTEITGWTVTNAIGNFELVEGAANIYRDSTAEGDTPRSVKFTTSDKLSQNFNIQNAQFDPEIPYYCQVAVNKTVGTGVGGNFILRLGGVSTTLALTAFSAGWNIVKIALGTSSWFENWNEEDPDIEIEWATASSGYLLVDDLVIAPFQPFDGGWYAMVGGSTPFLRDDVFTFTDTETGAILQEWFWRVYGRYLPHATSLPSWAEPT